MSTGIESDESAIGPVRGVLFDTGRQFNQGTRFGPYMFRKLINVRQFCLTAITFALSLVAILLAASQQPLFADTRSGSMLAGHNLFHMCTAVASDANGDEKFRACENNISRVRGQLRRAPVHDFRACVPTDVTTLDNVFTVIRWIETNPDRKSRDADDVVAEALSARWPCPGKTG